MKAKTVGVVTGAGSGMGLTYATGLAGMVDVLLLADVNEGAVADAAQHLRMATGAPPLMPLPSTSPTKTHWPPSR